MATARGFAASFSGGSWRAELAHLLVLLYPHFQLSVTNILAEHGLVLLFFKWKSELKQVAVQQFRVLRSILRLIGEKLVIDTIVVPIKTIGS